MRSPLLTVGLVILGPLVLFLGFPLTRITTANREALTLDEAARRKAPSGSFVKLSAGVTHYELAGPEGGPVVFLIPGFSTTYNIWDPTFDGLVKSGLRVLRYDLFGRGWSDRPEGAYDAAFFDRQAVELLDALHIPLVDVAGVSVGGPIAVIFANRHPERVRSVMLVDPGFFSGVRPPAGLRAPLLGDYNMAVNIAPALPQSQWKDFQHPERYPHYLDPYYEQMRYFGFRHALLQTLRNFVSLDVRDEFRALGRSGKPVLLVWGRNDQAVPFSVSSEVRAAVPQAEFHPIEDAAHIPHYEHPELVNPIIVAFLAGPPALPHN